MIGTGGPSQFRGSLALPNDSEPTLVVDLRVDDEVVVITQDSEPIGSWPVEEVAAERLNSQKFLLHLGEDDVIFYARDSLGFAYGGLTALEEAKERQAQKRQRWFNRLVDRNGRRDRTPDPRRVVTPPPTRSHNGQNGRRETHDNGHGSSVSAGDPWTAATPEAPPLEQAPLAPSTPSPVPDDEIAQIDMPGAADPSIEELEPPEAATSLQPTAEVVPQPAEPEPPPAVPQPIEPVPTARPLGVVDTSPGAPVAPPAPPPPAPEQTRPAVTRRGRRRRPKRDHVHEYEETRIPGGLVRRVCLCGSVVIRAVDEPATTSEAAPVDGT